MWFFYVHYLVNVLEVLHMLRAACLKETYAMFFLPAVRVHNFGIVAACVEKPHNCRSSLYKAQ